jgi:hypothetical protein
MILLEKHLNSQLQPAIQQREMDFLSRGVIISRRSRLRRSRQRRQLQAKDYKTCTLRKTSILEVLEPVVKADYTFKTEGPVTLVEEKEIPKIFSTLYSFSC